jgi:hypothetical protein
LRVIRRERAMRLHPQLIEFIAESIIADLERDNIIAVDDDRLLIGLVENIIEQEMDLERELDEEVREILADHYEQMRSAGMSYDDMFRKVKAQLAQEKDIVL